MSPEQLWNTARRALGVYFLIIGALFFPTAVAALGFVTEGFPRWPLVIAPLCQGFMSLLAGWWLLRGPEFVVDDGGGGWKTGSIAPVLQLMGAYFLVEGLASTVELAINVYFFGEAWQVRLGSFGSAVVTLAAGVLLVTRPSAIVLRIAGFTKSRA